MPIVIKLEGRLNRERVEEAFNKLIRRHESLRTSFEMIDGEPVQRVHENIDFTVKYYESSGSGAREIVGHFVEPFDLVKAPLLSLGLIKLEEHTHVLMFDMHHIVTDGTSMRIFINDLLAFYSGKKLAPLRLQYKDFSQWQYDRLNRGELKREEKYWIEHLSGELPVLKMPTDYPRPEIQSFEGDVIDFHFDKQLSRNLDRLMRETGTTLYMILSAVYCVLLSKYTEQEDIIIGTPVAGRSHADLANIIGLLLETLAIRNYPKAEKTFEMFLMEVKENTLKAYENQAYPFRELVQQVGGEDDPSRNPLFDAMLLVQNIDTRMENTGLEELRAVPYGEKAVHRVSKVDLTLEASERGEEILLKLEYCTRLFKKETAERFTRLFKEITESVVNNRKIKLAEIEIFHQLVEAAAHVYEDVDSEFEF